MLGDFINRSLVLVLGYAYPGFECYKAVEKNRVEIEELRFWCKYWITVALITVLERFADIFIGWLPMYGEMKVMFFIYLWYPKTRGTAYVYETLLRPIISSHENDIDRKLLEWRARAWDFAIFYWQYCARFGHTAFVQILQQLAAQTTRIPINPNNTKKNEVQVQVQGQSQSTPDLASIRSSFAESKQDSSLRKSNKWPPSPPSTPNKTIHRNISVTPKSKTENLEEEALDPEPINMEDDDKEGSVKDRINRARARLSRLSTQNSLNQRSPRTPTRREL